MWFVQDFITKWQCQGANIRTWCSQSVWWANFEKVAPVSWLKKKKKKCLESWAIFGHCNTYLPASAISLLLWGSISFTLPWIIGKQRKMEKKTSQNWRTESEGRKKRKQEKKKKDGRNTDEGCWLLRALYQVLGKNWSFRWWQSLSKYTSSASYTLLSEDRNIVNLVKLFASIILCFNCKNP